MPVEAYGRPYAPEFGAYPRPRLDRIGAGAAGAAAPVLPSTRIIPFRISVNTGTRSTHSPTQLQGYAVIEDVVYTVTNVAAGQDMKEWLEFGYAPQAVEESLVALGTSKPWSSIFQRLAVTGTDLDPNVTGIFADTQLTQQAYYTRLLRAPIPTPNQFLVISVGDNAGVTVEYRGHVRITENVDPAALANFL